MVLIIPQEFLSSFFGTSLTARPVQRGGLVCMFVRGAELFHVTVAITWVYAGCEITVHPDASALALQA